MVHGPLLSLQLAVLGFGRDADKGGGTQLSALRRPRLPGFEPRAARYWMPCVRAAFITSDFFSFCRCQRSGP